MANASGPATVTMLSMADARNSIDDSHAVIPQKGATDIGGNELNRTL